MLSRIMSNPHQKPETQEDWKALCWSYGGPKPSQMKEFYVHIDPSVMCAYLVAME